MTSVRFYLSIGLWLASSLPQTPNRLIKKLFEQVKAAKLALINHRVSRLDNDRKLLGKRDLWAK